MKPFSLFRIRNFFNAVKITARSYNSVLIQPENFEMLSELSEKHLIILEIQHWNIIYCPKHILAKLDRNRMKDKAFYTCFCLSPPHCLRLGFKENERERGENGISPHPCT